MAGTQLDRIGTHIESIKDEAARISLKGIVAPAMNVFQEPEQLAELIDSTPDEFLIVMTPQFGGFGTDTEVSLLRDLSKHIKKGK